MGPASATVAAKWILGLIFFIFAGKPVLDATQDKMQQDVVARRYPETTKCKRTRGIWTGDLVRQTVKRSLPLDALVAAEVLASRMPNKGPYAAHFKFKGLRLPGRAPSEPASGPAPGSREWNNDHPKLRNQTSAAEKSGDKQDTSRDEAYSSADEAQEEDAAGVPWLLIGGAALAVAGVGVYRRRQQRRAERKAARNQLRRYVEARGGLEGGSESSSGASTPASGEGGDGAATESECTDNEGRGWLRWIKRR